MPVSRRLVFYAWASTNPNHPFRRVVGAQTLAALDPEDVVLDHGDDHLTAVEIDDIGGDGTPTRLVLHALHGPGSRPSQWGPGEGARRITIGRGRYTAFSSHALIWEDKIAAIEMHANAPGLGRLSRYFWSLATERVSFRPLYEQRTADKLRDLDGIRGVDFAIHEPEKLLRARQRGMLAPLIDPRFPSIHVSAGMSRKQPKDAYIDDDMADELFELADVAEQYFDRIKIRGRSKTLRTPSGQKKSIEVNLLTERLQVEQSMRSARGNPSMPSASAAFDGLDSARRELDRNGQLAAAVEARLALDAEA